MKKKIILIHIVLIAIFFMTCTRDKIDSINKCENGFELISNECQCPDGKFEAYGFCQELTEMEWYGITDDCMCQDTIFFKIKKIEDGRASIFLNNNISRRFSEPGGHLRGSFELDYFALSDGDSLASYSLPYGELTCNTDEDLQPEFSINFYGKFSPSKDILKMEFTYRSLPGYQYAESCQVLFHK